jgi:hypothetical protein
MTNWMPSSTIYVLAVAERWAEAEAQIVHPRAGASRSSPTPISATSWPATQPRRIVLKARQIGFSQVFALEALYAALTEAEQTILLIAFAGSGREPAALLLFDL